MLSTYKAILKGNRLEWSESVPDQLASEQGIPVYVTILDKALDSPPTTPGQRMAQVLEQLAAANALSDLTDPAGWEREVRQDRLLPGRPE